MAVLAHWVLRLVVSRFHTATSCSTSNRGTVNGRGSRRPNCRILCDRRRIRDRPAVWESSEVSENEREAAGSEWPPQSGLPDSDSTDESLWADFAIVGRLTLSIVQHQRDLRISSATRRPDCMAPLMDPFVR